jgi:hypothetical protein
VSSGGEIAKNSASWPRDHPPGLSDATVGKCALMRNRATAQRNESLFEKLFETPSTDLLDNESKALSGERSRKRLIPNTDQNHGRSDGFKVQFG